MRDNLRHGPQQEKLSPANSVQNEVLPEPAEAFSWLIYGKVLWGGVSGGIFSKMICFNASENECWTVSKKRLWITQPCRFFPENERHENCPYPRKSGSACLVKRASSIAAFLCTNPRADPAWVMGWGARIKCRKQNTTWVFQTIKPPTHHTSKKTTVNVETW